VLIDFFTTDLREDEERQAIKKAEFVQLVEVCTWRDSSLRAKCLAFSNVAWMCQRRRSTTKCLKRCWSAPVLRGH
jgi:hypothetical protein